MKSLPRPAAKRAARLCLVLFTIGLPGGCGACDDDSLSDVRCKPGNPARGNFDRTLPELCSNLLDDNCNGAVNEGCDCLDGETRVCGNQVTDGIGPCHTGIETCADGQWGECVGAVDPQEEICDGADNDCDGAIDAPDVDLLPQECPWNGRADAVFGGASTCQLGLRYCENSRWSECRGEVLPIEQELCDGYDDDCDGEVDNNPFDEGVSCGPAEERGICKRGFTICHRGEQSCEDDVWPKMSEDCNGKDDDCDGSIDEEVPDRLCHNGACLGFERCEAGYWVGCTAPVPEPAEICQDGIDNNCDGVVDEDCSCREYARRDCLPPESCGQGLQTCLNGEWGPCELPISIPEQCNGGHDDDCDLATGEETAAPRACGSDVGLCSPGLQMCQPDGSWGTCEGSIGPETETCNIQDDDCDGQIDEGIVRRQAVAILILVDQSGSMCSPYPYTPNIRLALHDFADDLQTTPHLLNLAVVPGNGPGQVMTSLTNGFVTPAAFQAALANLDCNGGGQEPNLDALRASTDPTSPLAVSWPTGYYPYVIWIGDENNQSWTGLNEAQVAQSTTVCQLPGCQPPECDPQAGCQPGPPEVFVIEAAVYEPTYSAILNNTVNVRDRFFEIDSADLAVYKAHLRSIFESVCLGA